MKDYHFWLLLAAIYLSPKCEERFAVAVGALGAVTAAVLFLLHVA